MTNQFITVSNGELISEATFDGSEAEENEAQPLVGHFAPYFAIQSLL